MRGVVPLEAAKPLAQLFAWAFARSMGPGDVVFPMWLKHMLYSPEIDDARSVVALVAALDAGSRAAGPVPTFEDLAPLFHVFEEDPYTAAALTDIVISSTCRDVSTEEVTQRPT